MAFFWLAGLLLNYYNIILGIAGVTLLGSHKPKTVSLSDQEELVLKVTKEIVVKFIEVGRVSPTNFAELFKVVNDTVRQSIKS